MFYRQLADNLSKQVTEHRAMLEALQEEAGLPADCSVPVLEGVHRIRDQAARNIKRLESERVELMELYRRDRKVVESVSLREIIEKCDSDMKRTLSHNRLKLQDLIRQISSAGSIAANRATARIACFQEVQSAIQKALLRPPTYSKGGLIEKPQGACLVQRCV